MSDNKQFTLYTQQSGPNAWKVAIVLEELGLTYETVYLDLGRESTKHHELFQQCPSTTTLAIVDHYEDDFVLWDSDTIVQYLVDRYDTLHTISASTERDRYKQLQWLLFRASAQRTCCGNAAWFVRFQRDKVASAQERYREEARELFGVLERVLSTRAWLVGNKPTVADIVFVPWNDIAMDGFLDFDVELEFPATAAWYRKLRGRVAVEKVMGVRPKHS